MTTETEPTPAVKLCVGCQATKNLSGGFYRAGNSWQKYCKPCHNTRRNNTPRVSKYVKKQTGFGKLSPELQEKIKYDIYVRINFKDISKRYPEVKYQTLLLWNRKKQIPKWICSASNLPDNQIPADRPTTV